MQSLLTSRLDGHSKALGLLAHRQSVLASNIANADTPGYKAKDFNFAAALTNARNGTQPVLAMSSKQLGSTPSSVADSSQDVPLQWRRVEQPSLDGNTVDLDRERAEFADNAMRYEATLRFINSDVRNMLSAITGQ